MLSYLYALLAAMSNSGRGVMSTYGFNKDLTFYQVAFFECFFAFLILSVCAVFNEHIRKEIAHLRYQKSKILVLSFFGVFLLYYFETKAFFLVPVGIVTILVYSMSILTVILGYFILKEPINSRKIFCLFMVLSGASLIFNNFATDGIDSIMYALIAGMGYSVFLVLCRKFHITVNVGFLWWLMGLGCLCLLLPSVLFIDSLTIPEYGYENLILLAIVTTLISFYFTAKALVRSEAGRVQVIEMSDPLFATIWAFLFLGEVINTQEMMGGLLIIIGLVLIE